MLISIDKASKMFGVTQTTLRNWEKKGFIKPLRTPGKQRRYDVDEINKILSGGAVHEEGKEYNNRNTY